MRSALQKSLEKSLQQVEAQLREKADAKVDAKVDAKADAKVDAIAVGSVDTQVFYDRFRWAALNYKPLMQLLNKRLDLHETYAATLEELEAFYVHLRLRLVSSHVSTHLHGRLPHDLPSTELASAARTAATYVINVSGFERQCFEAYFEIRQPQEALRTLLENMADIFYKAVRPMVIKCTNIDSLREVADCLQMDILEPHPTKGDLAPVMTVVFQLHRDVQEKLIFCTQTYIREEIRGFKMNDSHLCYPSILFEGEEGEKFQGWFPTLQLTLNILAKIYRVLEMSTFQGLAQEAVDICISSLKQASEHLAQRAIHAPLGALVQMMDSTLFLIKHLLILREQVAAFECDLVVSEKYFNFSNVWEAFHLKLPEGILGILKPTIHESQVDSKKDIESELKGACEMLITNLTANITSPLAALNTQIDVYLATGDRQKLREQPFMTADNLRQTVEPFLVNVRERVPFIASHIRLYLTTGAEAGGLQSTASILFKPVQSRMVDTWKRLENLLVELCLSSSQMEEMGFISPSEMDNLVSSLFAATMEEPWTTLFQTILSVPRPETPVAQDAKPVAQEVKPDAQDVSEPALAV